ncbi:MAG TPA: translocation/assembly module TamB domain-containing protein [Anaeromyxobacteraceae bacterium]|nr:translocation/assembly module TamB domain-containing protein [Anaeromyxobacteraceae bacterium]
MKRKLAIAFLATVLGLAGGALLLVRSPLVGDRLCALAEQRVGAATGQPLAIASCRLDPFRLEARLEGVRLGPAEAPLFTAERLQVRLAALQPIGGKLHFAAVAAVAPRVNVVLPAPRPGGPPATCPPPILSKLDVHELRVERGSLELGLPGGGRISAGRIDVATGPAGLAGSLRALAGRTPRAKVEVDARDLAFTSGARSVRLEALRVRSDLAVDLSGATVHEARLEGGGTTLSLSGELDDLCKPRVDLRARLSGPLATVLAAAGGPPPQTGGRLDLSVRARGPVAKLEAQGELALVGARLDGWEPGDLKAGFRFGGRELRVERLELPVAGGGRIAARGKVTFGKEVGLEAEADVERAELGEVLRRLRIPGAWVMGKVGGKLRVHGTASPLRLAGDGALDLSDFKVLDHSWARYRPGEPTVLDLARARVEAPLRVDRDGVHIEGGRVRSGQGALDVTALLHFDDARGFRVGVAGPIDLGVLRHVASVPFDGQGPIQATIVAAPYGTPRVTGRARLSRFRILGLALGELEGRFALDGFVLRAEEVSGRMGATSYGGGLAIDLGASPVAIRDARFSMRGRLGDLFEAAEGWQPFARTLRGLIDGEAAGELSFAGPVTALDAAFSARLGQGTLAERAFARGAVAGRVERGRRLVFESAELRQAGGGVLRGGGSLGLEAPFPLDLALSVSGLRLEELGIPGGWSGSVSGEGGLRGPRDAPRGTFALNADQTALGPVALGTAQLGGRVEGRALSFTASAEGARISGTARLEGDLPYEAKGSLELEDASRRIPSLAQKGVKVRLRGDATARGSLTDLGASRAEVRFAAVGVALGELRLENEAPVTLRLDRGALSVDALTLRGQSTRLALSGSRAASGALAVEAQLALDLKLLAGALPGVVAPRGQLTAEARVGGTFAEPALVGSGRLRDGGFQLERVPITFAAMDGDLSFSQNRVLLPAVAATVNGGKASLSGEVELARMWPSRIRLRGVLDEVPARIPEWIPSQLSGELAFEGTFEAMSLSGRLHVLRARYTELVDLEKRLLTVRRRASQAPRPFDRSGEWLRFDVNLAVDGDVRVENDLLRGPVTGNVTLVGSAASPGLLGSLSMAQGSRATFRGNEFTLSHAVMDFSDRTRLRASLDANGEAQVKDYRVFMSVTGPYESPRLQLTSTPALSQEDLITLLSLGYTARDTAAAGGVGGVATAAAAQALFSASGLDAQVRRFLPRGGVLSDFGMRITSAYSEASGQVEPRAELESRALEDRLRLRYQAPMSGGRGQRAQAELKLGDHTSLQYQWDNETPDVVTEFGGDHGLDLKLRWEWVE